MDALFRHLAASSVSILRTRRLGGSWSASVEGSLSPGRAIFQREGMKIALASDHAGFDYKQVIKHWLTERGHEVKDLGTFSNERADYPDFIRPAAEAVARGEC